MHNSLVCSANTRTIELFFEFTYLSGSNCGGTLHMHLILTSVVEHLHSSQARRCCPDQDIIFLSLVGREGSSPLIKVNHRPQYWTGSVCPTSITIPPRYTAGCNKLLCRCNSNAELCRNKWPLRLKTLRKFYGITNRCDNVQWNLFLCKSTLHISGCTHAHHQEYNFNCINSHWYNS